MNSLMQMLFASARLMGLCALAVCVMGSSAPAPGSARQTGTKNLIRIGGTGSALGTARLLSSEFLKSHPRVRVEIIPSLGSRGAIRAVIEGALDIGFVSRPLSREEQDQGMVEREYGRTPFVFATSTHNPVDGMRLDDLIDIYEGKRTTWPDGEPIRLILRPASDTDSILLKNIWPAMHASVEKARSRSGLMTAITDQDGADAIERIPGALGTCSLSLILSEKRRIKALSLNGIRPSVQALRDGAYPYCKRFSVVTRTQQSGLVKQFIDFLYSQPGRSILISTGHEVVP